MFNIYLLFKTLNLQQILDGWFFCKLHEDAKDKHQFSVASFFFTSKTGLHASYSYNDITDSLVDNSYYKCSKDQMGNFHEKFKEINNKFNICISITNQEPRKLNKNFSHD